ncbi:hypothetical protein [Pseudomonas fluorescens]|jgi:hypothetical protein|uniref:hypothetical protein n=1 Tax=Pseudomonas TaxID=286 RepID=UPI0011D2657A|nr:hypothetical protein [Pseudomonas fluorescens]
MQGYNREASFYLVTFHWVEIINGSPLIRTNEQFFPGRKIEIVQSYFPNDTGISVQTSPTWSDLLEINDGDTDVNFQFRINNSWITVDEKNPGYGYIREYYRDFVQERERAYREEY